MDRFIRLVLLALLVAATASCSDPGHVDGRWDALGTYASAEIHAVDQETAEEAVSRVREVFDRVDATMSSWRDDSLLATLNREAGRRPFVVEDPELFRCVKLAREFAKRSGGAFDPTVGPLMRLHGFRPPEPRIPSDSEILLTLAHVGWERFEVLPEASAVRFLDPGVELDLGGIANGYALDIAARGFARPGIRSGRLELGGTVYAWAKPPGLDAWPVDIRDPDDPETVMAVVDLLGRALSTTGGETSHVLDPRTGRPARSDVFSATVISDSGIEADALSTAFYVAGSQRTAAMLEGSRRIQVFLVIDTAGGPAVLASATLRDRLRFTPSFLELVGDRIRYLLPGEM